MWGYIVLLLEAIIDEALYDAGLASAGVAEQDGLEGALAHRRGSYRHLNNRIRRTTASLYHAGNAFFDFERLISDILAR